MIPLATAAIMTQIETQAVVRQKLTLLDLMQKAGHQVALQARKMVSPGSLVYIFCGPGNNGGDGFVAARELLEQGYKVVVFLLIEPEKIKGEAKEVFLRLTKTQAEAVKSFSLESFKRLPKPDLVIDGIFGFNFKNELTGKFKEAVAAINALNVPVLAIDVPSGLITDTGQIGGIAIKAERTVTFTAAKVGLKMYPGASYAGEVVTANLGIKDTTVNEFCTIYEPEASDIALLLPERPPDAHKGSCGRVLVLGGSEGLTGAAAMTAQAALKIGSGIVILGLPKSLNDLMEVKLTEVIAWPLPETLKRSLAKEAASQIVSRLPDFNCLVIGPGLSTNLETAGLVKEVVTANKSTPQVIDADALNCLATNPELFNQINVPTVITPHPGELSRLLKVDIAQIQADRLHWAEEAFKRFQVTVLLKGARTVIRDADKTYLNPTGNSGLATAGTGDILSGFIGGLVAQGLSVPQAALAGSYLHGLAADLAVKDLTEYCLTATDLLTYLPEAIKKVRMARRVPG